MWPYRPPRTVKVSLNSCRSLPLTSCRLTHATQLEQLTSHVRRSCAVIGWRNRLTLPAEDWMTLTQHETQGFPFSRCAQTFSALANLVAATVTLVTLLTAAIDEFRNSSPRRWLVRALRRTSSAWQERPRGRKSQRKSESKQLLFRLLDFTLW